MGEYENRLKRKHLWNEGRKVNRLHHNRRGNKARPSKNTSDNEKPHPRRPRPDTTPIPTASKHRRVYTKTSGTHVSHTKSSPKHRFGGRAQLDERGRISHPEDKKKVAKIANTNHAKGSRSANTLLITKEKNNPSFNSHNTVSKDNFPEASNQAEIRTYNISYVRTNEAEGQMVNKFLKQKELLPHMWKGKEEGAHRQSNEPQEGLTPTPRAWRLYLRREAGKEGSGVGIILLGPDEKTYSYAIRLNFDAPDHNMDYEALLAGLVASAGKGMKDLHVFVDSQILVDQVPDHASSQNLNSKAEVLTEVGSNDKERKATSKVPMRKPNYNWETSGSN
ncbi:reverse transcriptase domain-containing protein [Tanacetum coccineum]